MHDLVVVTGGARSGKSAYAESLLRGEPDVTYVATAQATDDEMRARIAAHQARRAPHWRTVTDSDLAAVVAAAPGAVLVDGLGLWLAAYLDRTDAEILAAVDALAGAPAKGPVVVVAEQAGSGLVPADALSRRWADLLGAALQRLSARASRVVLVVAGRAVDLPLAAAPGAPAASRAHGDTMVPPGALDLAVNVYGDGPPPHVRAVLADTVTTLGRYPDAGPACEAVAARHGRHPDEVLPTAGAAEAFWLLAHAVRARLAAVVHPQFTEPEAALRAAGVAVTHVLRRAAGDWRLDPAAVPDDADVVVVGNPNNPTGTLDPVASVAALCRPGRVTVVDEAFMDFVPDEVTASVAGRADLPGLVVVRSATKLWGLAGLRAGYLLAAPGLARRCAAARQPWAVSSEALAALRVCAADEDYRAGVARTVAAQRAALVDDLRAVAGVTVWDGAANFVLCRVPDGPRVHRALLDRGIAVRPSTFPGLSPDHLRVAVRDAAATAALCAALADVLAEVPA